MSFLLYSRYDYIIASSTANASGRQFKKYDSAEKGPILSIDEQKLNIVAVVLRSVKLRSMT